mmetsp:Transcript_14393/g.24993  ORF Transcript_14393/g.24993 Transcript_14393/m.24993 type:complete len:109 (-) Transcript_14393:327-653(-)
MSSTTSNISKNLKTVEEVLIFPVSLTLQRHGVHTRCEQSVLQSVCYTEIFHLPFASILQLTKLPPCVYGTEVRVQSHLKTYTKTSSAPAASLMCELQSSSSSSVSSSI